jgi:molecular chaperone HscB
VVAVADYFSLFGLPVCFKIDAGQLEQSRLAVVACVHPDRYATASPTERRVAMQWSAHANQAYQQLRDPLLRARYLCELAGIDLQTENNTCMDPDFLMQQMQWREQLDEIRLTAAPAVALQALGVELQAAQAVLQDAVAELLDTQGNYPVAANKIREWMFVRKMCQEVASWVSESNIK